MSAIFNFNPVCGLLVAGGTKIWLLGIVAKVELEKCHRDVGVFQELVAYGVRLPLVFYQEGCCECFRNTNRVGHLVNVRILQSKDFILRHEHI